MSADALKTEPSRNSLVSYLYEPKVRSVIYQVALLVALVMLGWEIVTNTAENLRRQNIASGFGFLNRTTSQHFHIRCFANLSYHRKSS